MSIPLVQKILVTAIGGTFVVDVDSAINVINITSASAITLTGAVTINTSGTLIKDMYLKFIFDGNITSDTATGKVIRIFGTELTEAQSLYEGEITAYYNGTAWQVRIYPDAESGNANIDGSNIAAGTIPNSALTDSSITNSKLATLNRGSIKVGDATNTPSDLVANTNAQLLIGDGTDLKSVPVTGDITIDNAGVTTIGAGKITDTMLSSSVSYDSGWKTMNDWSAGQGFGLPPFTSGTHPQIRVIDRRVFIEGQIIIPLDDGAGGLVTDTSLYASTYKTKVGVSQNANYGYKLTSTGGAAGSLQSRVVLPANLFPSADHSINRNFFFHRAIQDGTAVKSLILTSYAVTFTLKADGTIYISLLKNLSDSALGGEALKNIGLHSLITNVKKGDFVIDYSSYKNSFTGAVDNRVSSVTAFTYPVAFDGENETQIGGFALDMTTSYTVSNLISLTNIKAAFDSI